MHSTPQLIRESLLPLLTESDLSEQDRTLVLEFAQEEPTKLLRILQALKEDAKRRRYLNTRSEKALASLLKQDSEMLSLKARQSLRGNDALKYRRQARVLEDIAEWLYRNESINDHLLRLLRGSEQEKLKAGKIVDEFGKIIMRAARAELLDHPFIQSFTSRQRLTHNKPLLRKAKIGLESRLLKPIPDLHLDIVALHDRGLSLQQISQRLKAEGKRLSKSAVHKILSKFIK